MSNLEIFPLEKDGSELPAGEFRTPAGLALPDPDEIPSLLPTLARIESMHPHKYHEEITVSAMLADARRAQATGQELTDEQAQIIEDQAVLEAFVPSRAYENVYTPRELALLADTLSLLRQRNRPDFNGIEARLIDVVLSNPSYASSAKLPISFSSLKGLKARESSDAPTRRGMQWGTFNALASAGSEVIRNQISYKGDRGSYLLKVYDPDFPKAKPDLTPIYQFTADIVATDIMGERSAAVDEARRLAFEHNCGVINDYWAEVSTVISGLPPEIRGSRFAATYELPEMIDTMNQRLSGRVVTGKLKNYKQDPAGAISLQLKIGHTIESIKQQITDIKSGRAAEEEITPLE